jgi:hypothetical protein
MSGAIPCIVIGPPAEAAATPTPGLIDMLVQWLGQLRHDPDLAPSEMGGGVGVVLQGLVQEGRAFSRTASGARWRSILAPSPIAAKGWLLWNAMDLDRLAASASAAAASPGERAEALMRHIGAAPLETVMRAASDVALAQAARMPADD